MGATTIVVSGGSPVLASTPGPSPRRYGGWERPTYEDRYRRDYGQPSDYIADSVSETKARDIAKAITDKLRVKQQRPAR